MKTYYFLLLCTVALSARLDIDSVECSNYLNKFQTINSQNGVGLTQLSFTGDVAFVQETTNIQVDLRYSDPLFNDPTYWGLVQEDVKTADETCLDLKLLKFGNSSYENPIQVTDLSLTASSDANNNWRYLSFFINRSEFKYRMIQSQNSNQYLYTGYYGIAYYAAGTTLIKYNFYFEFTVVIKKSSDEGVSTVFKPLNRFESYIPDQPLYIPAPLSKISQWCTRTTCDTNTIQDFYFKDDISIRQQVTAPGLTDYYLTNTTVYFVADGLNQKADYQYIENSAIGQVDVWLYVNIAWSNVTIRVTSYLSTAESSTIYDPISATSDTQICIRVSRGRNKCVNCAEQCDSNDGIAASSCNACLNSASLLTAALLILLLQVL